MSPDIQNGDLLKAIEMAIPARAIEQAMPSASRFASTLTLKAKKNVSAHYQHNWW
ncbi:MAG: hypothetical protein PUP92_16020 [Rhizonema sp. PD38]|nr:hypothetical protein [Rhizonema sp. PD38]